MQFHIANWKFLLCKLMQQASGGNRRFRIEQFKIGTLSHNQMLCLAILLLTDVAPEKGFNLFSLCIEFQKKRSNYQ